MEKKPIQPSPLKPRRCWWCNGVFTPNRKDKRFHNDLCRALYRRAMLRMQKRHGADDEKEVNRGSPSSLRRLEAESAG
jgi:hypothetical protein